MLTYKCDYCQAFQDEFNSEKPWVCVSGTFGYIIKCGDCQDRQKYMRWVNRMNQIRQSFGLASVLPNTAMSRPPPDQQSDSLPPITAQSAKE